MTHWNPKMEDAPNGILLLFRSSQRHDIATTGEFLDADHVMIRLRTFYGTTVIEPSAFDAWAPMPMEAVN